MIEPERVLHITEALLSNEAPERRLLRDRAIQERIDDSMPIWFCVVQIGAVGTWSIRQSTPRNARFRPTLPARAFATKRDPLAGLQVFFAVDHDVWDMNGVPLS